MSLFLGELVGTAILIIFGNGIGAGNSLRRSYSNSSGWIVITLAWGLAVVMGVFAVGGITGAHLNPAVTLGLAATGAFPWNEVPIYIAGQMLGAIIGASIVFCHYMPHWGATEDPGAKLGVFCTGPAIPNTFANLLSEIIGTFVLLLGLSFIGLNSFADGLNPLAVGALIVAIGMSLGGTTGYAINPARDLGPRIAHAILPIPGKGGSNWGYSWIPVIGPILGGILGALTFQVLFPNDLESAVIPAGPGPDSSDIMIWFWVFLAITLAVIALAFFGSRRQDYYADNCD